MANKKSPVGAGSKPAPMRTPAPVRGTVTVRTPASGYFFPYQTRWLLDDSMIKLWEKSRRIGATYVQSYEDVSDVATKKEYVKGKPVRKVYFTSADESAAREYIEYCAQWAELFNIAAKETGEVVLDSKHDVKALCIEFKNGGKIYALTSNPKRFRSKGGKVVIDEFAYHDDQYAMWKAAKATAMWGMPTRILSTHNGKQCLYYQFVEDTKAGKTGWSIHTVPIQLAVAEGLADKILGRKLTDAERAEWLETERRNYRSEDAWQEECCCNAIDSATAYLPYDIISAVESSTCLMSLDQLAELTEGDLYAGYDPARIKDRAVFWVEQKLGDVTITRFVKAFEKTRFSIQMDFLDQLMKLKRLRRICIDKTGMGMPLVEQAQEKYSTRVEGVMFTTATKEEMAVHAKNRIEDVRCRIPSNPTVRESFHSIKRFKAGGNVRFDAEATEATGHADEWWAFCLCENAAKSKGGIPHVKSRPRPSYTKTTEGY